MIFCIFWSLKLTQIKIQSPWNCKKCHFLNLYKPQNWFHVKSMWQKNAKNFPHQHCKNHIWQTLNWFLIFFDFFFRTLVDACNEGDFSKVRKLLDEGRVSVHDTTEEGESLLSLACSAGYYELAQVRLLLKWYTTVWKLRKFSLTLFWQNQSEMAFRP